MSDVRGQHLFLPRPSRRRQSGGYSARALLVASLVGTACGFATPSAVDGGRAVAGNGTRDSADRAVTAAVPSSGGDRSPARRGANVPWVEYEAEDAATNGVILMPSRAYGTIAAESSGRRSVQLNAVGHYVEVTATRAANALVVRYAIPDAPAGGGIDATLNLYVNGVFRRALNLTSKYAWSYGGESASSNDPALGGQHHFFDEARALVGDIPAGARVKFQKDETNTAPFYVIDLVDLEAVAPPLTNPAGFLSLTADCGAVADDDGDDSQALQSCIHTARMRKKGVFVPTGVFDLTTRVESDLGIMVADVTVRGAGMWHSTLRGRWARFHCRGNNCRFADFAILGETVTRDEDIPENAFNGGAGTGSRLDNIWVEHTKVGFWVGAGTENVTDGLVIANSRFRNLFAEGVNFCNGTSNSEVVDSHFRNTGDDALASWSPRFDGGVNANNVFHFNTVQLPWRASCFAVYGGRGNTVANNLCYDVVALAGILVAQQFSSHPFSGITTVRDNSLIRAGGLAANQQHGALKILSAEGPISGLVVKNVDIDSPSFSGLDIQGPAPLHDGTLDNVTITDAASFGIVVRPSARGTATFSNVTVVRSADAAMSSEPAPSLFAAIKGRGNGGW